MRKTCACRFQGVLVACAFSLECLELVGGNGTGDNERGEGFGLDDGSLKIWLWDWSVGCGVCSSMRSRAERSRGRDVNHVSRRRVPSTRKHSLSSPRRWTRPPFNLPTHDHGRQSKAADGAAASVALSVDTASPHQTNSPHKGCFKT